LKEKEVIKISYSTEKEDLERLAHLATDKCVAILIHGDPSVSDWQFMEKLRTLCRSRSIRCEVIPGVSSLNVALLKERLDMVETIFITLHTEGAEKYYEEILRMVSTRRKIVLFSEPYRDGPQRVARYLIDKGFKGIARIYESLTYQNERFYEYKLEDLAKEKRAFTDLCIMILEIRYDP
jgi:cobalt-precorrin-7 (C5)-methyltransferase